MLSEHIHPPWKDAAGESDDHASLAHLIGPRDVERQADRIPGGQHKPHRSDLDTLCLEQKVKQMRRRRGAGLEPLGIKMMLGEGYRGKSRCFDQPKGSGVR